MGRVGVEDGYFSIDFRKYCDIKLRGGNVEMRGIAGYVERKDLYTINYIYI